MPGWIGRRFAYSGLLAGALVVALAASWTPLGAQIDNSVYDWIFRVANQQPWQPESIVLAIDEASLKVFGGRLGLRGALAEGLERIAAAPPKAVAVDAILADASDPDSDDRLEAAFRATHNLILPCDLPADGSGWDDPLSRFGRWAVAVGHVHADVDTERVARALPLEKVFGHDRRWALALEAFRVSRRVSIVETPRAIEVGEVSIPASRSSGRAMRIRYLPPMGRIPSVSLKELSDNPALVRRFAGKIVFAGVTAQTEVRDRWFTPYYSPTPMPGVEIHANAFETIAQGRFLPSAPAWSVVAFCMLLAAAAGMTFAWLSGWWANGVALGLLALAHAAPYAAFTRNTVFPFAPGVATAWLAIVTAAASAAPLRAAADGEIRGRARPLPAGHALRHARNAHAAHRHPGIERADRAATPMPEEKRKQIAQLDQLRIQAAGPHDRDISETWSGSPPARWS